MLSPTLGHFHIGHDSLSHPCLYLVKDKSLKDLHIFDGRKVIVQGDLDVRQHGHLGLDVVSRQDVHQGRGAQGVTWGVGGDRHLDGILPLGLQGTRGQG